VETLAAFLDGLVARHGDREVIAAAPRDSVDTRVTWVDLRAASRAAAWKLVHVGATKGSRVGVLCSNRVDWLVAAFGALRIGAILVPLSTLSTRDELAYALTYADVQVLVTLSGFLKHRYLNHLADIVPELRTAPPGHLHSSHAPMLRRVVLLDSAAPGGTESWTDLRADIDDAFLSALEASVVPADAATLFFTSGTTSRPKAVLHTHSALTTSARRLGACFGITPDDAWWGHMPLFWSGGFILALATLAGGGRIVLQERVDAGSALALLEREACTVMAGWHQGLSLLEHPDFAQRRLRLKKGTHHPLATRLLGDDHVAVGVYGMSETATGVSASCWDTPAAMRTGTFGKPLAGMEVRILDPESGRPVTPGDNGEIAVKGPTLMEGYYKVPRPDTFDAAGFFRTGDLGRIDDAGYLHFTRRIKDVIKTAGANVAADEVEAALARHPAVQSAHVVGVPDTARGETAVAFVVIRDGYMIPVDELRAFCQRVLASYKVPRHLFTTSDAELPRTASGKIAKAALRRLATARIGAERA